MSLKFFPLDCDDLEGWDGGGEERSRGKGYTFDYIQLIIPVGSVVKNPLAMQETWI